MKLIILGSSKLRSRSELGLTLIELIVTITIIAFLVGISIKQFRMVKNTKNIIDNTTFIIVNQLNVANARSISEIEDNQAATVCHINSGSSQDFASCDPDRPVWSNSNGIKFSNKIVVSIQSNPSGTNIVTFRNRTVNLGNSSQPAFIITITGIEPDQSCTAASNIPINKINIWQNGVIDVDKNC